MLRAADKRLLVGSRLSRIAANQIAAPQGAVFGNTKAQMIALTAVGYWPMDDASGSVVDASGNGRDLDVTTGSPDYAQTGPWGGQRSIQYNGGEAHGRTTLVSTATNNFSIVCWLRPEVVGATYQNIFYNGNSAANGWGLMISTDFRLYYLAGGVAIGGASTASLSPNVWAHVAMVRDDGTWKYYVNGALDTANAGTSNPGTPSGGSTGTTAPASFQRRLAHVGLYESVLTAAQIRSLYNARRRYTA